MIEYHCLECKKYFPVKEEEAARFTECPSCHSKHVAQVTQMTGARWLQPLFEEKITLRMFLAPLIAFLTGCVFGHQLIPAIMDSFTSKPAEVAQATPADQTDVKKTPPPEASAVVTPAAAQAALPPAPVSATPTTIAATPIPMPGTPLPPVAPTAPLPMTLDLRPDGKIGFLDSVLTVTELKAKLEKLAQAEPDQPLVVKGGKKASKAQLDKVLAICQAAKLKNVTVEEDPSAPPKPTEK